MSNDEDQQQGLGLPRDSLSSKLKPYMAKLDQEVKSGVRHRRILEYLASEGITINLKTFRLYLYRWRKETGQQKKPKSDKTAAQTPKHKGGKKSQSQSAQAIKSMGRSKFREMRDEDIDLEGFAEEAKEGE